MYFLDSIMASTMDRSKKYTAVTDVLSRLFSGRLPRGERGKLPSSI